MPTMQENWWRLAAQGQIFVKSLWQGGHWMLCVHHLVDASSPRLGEMQTLVIGKFGPQTQPQPPVPLEMTERVEPSEF